MLASCSLFALGSYGLSLHACARARCVIIIIIIGKNMKTTIVEAGNLWFIIDMNNNKNMENPIKLVVSRTNISMWIYMCVCTINWAHTLIFSFAICISMDVWACVRALHVCLVSKYRFYSSFVRCVCVCFWFRFFFNDLFSIFNLFPVTFRSTFAKQTIIIIMIPFIRLSILEKNSIIIVAVAAAVVVAIIIIISSVFSSFEFEFVRVCFQFDAFFRRVHPQQQQQ